ncbi:insulinase family protein [candidate division KSB1 bacterium]|nr:insulinase family protein [candidate division KSB1 bacterium]
MKNISRFLSTSLLLVLLFATAFAQKPDRSGPPQLGPAASLKLPPLQQFSLKNGLRIYLMEKHNVPLVQANLYINSGSVDDPAAKLGLASITMDMLNEGAAGKNALELADAIDFLGANLGTGANMHSCEVTLNTPVSKLAAAFTLMADVVLRPDFPEDELKRIVKQRLNSLVQNHDQPGTIATAMFNKTIFGEDHPYGRTTLGNEKSLRSMNVDDLKAFFSNQFVANNAYMIIVGDVEEKNLKSLLEKNFGEWKKGKINKTQVTSAKPVAGRTIYLVDKPGSAQSVLRIGRIGINRTSDDYFAIKVMNTILGGSFASRLNTNLREEHGYTYGAGTYWDFRPSAGRFMAYSDVQTEVTDKAISEFFKEFAAIREPIPAEELQRGKNYDALSYPGDFEMIRNIAGAIQEMVEFDLPADYFNTYITNELAVTDDATLAVATKYVTPENMAIIIVGDREKIEPGIKELNLGEIKNYTIEDVLGKLPDLSDLN